jgi:hypothetical protein
VAVPTQPQRERLSRSAQRAVKRGRHFAGPFRDCCPQSVMKVPRGFRLESATATGGKRDPHHAAAGPVALALAFRHDLPRVIRSAGLCLSPFR